VAREGCCHDHRGNGHHHTGGPRPAPEPKRRSATHETTREQQNARTDGSVDRVITDTLDLTAEQFSAGTGWVIKPEGACQGDVCVPLPKKAEGFSAQAAAERLGMAIVADEPSGLWSIGPASFGDRALATAVAPELVLNDLDGNEFRLSSLRGQKVVIVSWAPY
jgi:hypothetical protein